MTHMAKEYAKRFYKSELWKSTRDYILKRDRYLCQRCKEQPATEVHHKVRLSPENINDPTISVNPENLVSLCGDCHKREHKEDRIKRNWNQEREILFDKDGNPVESPRGR